MYLRYRVFLLCVLSEMLSAPVFAPFSDPLGEESPSQHQAFSANASFEKSIRELGGMDFCFARTLLQKKTLGNYGWIHIDNEGLGAIKRFIGEDKVLAVCSGNGFYESFLQKEGVDIVATDLQDPAVDRNYVVKSKHMNIEKMDMMQAVEEYTGRNCLLMIAPPPRSKKGVTEAFKGNKLVYVGEIDGCPITGEQPNMEVWEEIEEKCSATFTTCPDNSGVGVHFLQRKSPL